MRTLIHLHTRPAPADAGQLNARLRTFSLLRNTARSALPGSTA